MQEASSDLIESIKTSSSHLNNIVLAGGALAGTLILLEISKKKEFTFAGVTIALDRFVFIAVSFTVAHLYCAVFHVERVNALLAAPINVRHSAWNYLSTRGPFVFLGMKMHPQLGSLQVPFLEEITMYNLELGDRTSYFIYGLSTSVFLSIYFSFSPTRKSSHAAKSLAFLCAFALTSANWIIGGWWVVKSAQLAL